MFNLAEGLEKVSFEEDSKVEHAGVFTFNLEDHTLGNLLRMQLLRDENVRFAGYKAPHPLEHKIEIKVQTDGQKSPQDAVRHALKMLMDEVDTMSASFDAQLQQSLSQI